MVRVEILGRLDDLPARDLFLRQCFYTAVNSGEIEIDGDTEMNISRVHGNVGPTYEFLCAADSLVAWINTTY